MEIRFTSAGLEKVFINNPKVFWQYIIVCILLDNRAFWLVMIYSTFNLQGALQTGTNVSSAMEIFKVSVDWHFLALARNMITVVRLVSLFYFYCLTSLKYTKFCAFILICLSIMGGRRRWRLRIEKQNWEHLIWRQYFFFHLNSSKRLLKSSLETLYPCVLGFLPV